MLNRKKETSVLPNKEDDQYFVIGVEDGYFDKVNDKEYVKAKQRLEGGYYAE